MNNVPTIPGRDVPGRPRTGFTLVECLVAVSIIGLLAAILVPAVMSARRMALRVQCLNNLRQIGVGLTNYAATFDAYPPGSAHGNSVHVSILPFLEQRALYAALNFARETESLQNATVMSAVIDGYLCPADVRYPVELGDWSWTSYAGNGGVNGLWRSGHNDNGAFDPGGGVVRFQAFVDGTSRTALMSEWRLGTYESADRDPRRSVFSVTSPDEPEPLAEFAARCRDVDVASAPVTRFRTGMDWTSGQFGKSLYTHAVGPNGHSCKGDYDAWTAGGWHVGGAHVVFADCSARFVRDGIAPHVWLALGTRDGGEIVSDDAY